MSGNQWYRKEKPLLSLLGMGGGAGSPASTAGVTLPDPSGITASGGTTSTFTEPDGVSWKCHVFTGSGTFSVSGVSGTGKVEYVVIAGGGSGPNGNGGGAGGGGAGGYRASVGSVSPLVEMSGGGESAEPAMTVSTSPGSYTVTVGGGAAASSSPIASEGSASQFGPISCTGGGAGNCSHPNPNAAGGAGGSGGGGGEFDGPQEEGGNGAAGQGYPGGEGCGPSPSNCGAGGGGAGGQGGQGSPESSVPAPLGGAGAREGGQGIQSRITGTAIWRGGGGGASGNGLAGGNGGNGGGGNGGGGSGGPGDSPGGLSSGTSNTGGGGGARYSTPGASTTGGSGIVIVRYVT